MRRHLLLGSIALLMTGHAGFAESPLELLFKQQRQSQVAILDEAPLPKRKVARDSAKGAIAPGRPADDSLISPSPKRLRPVQTTFISDYTPGTLVIDTSRHALYRVLDEREAMRYVVAVGKDGFEWSGTETISSRTKWPDWRPPAEMRDRDPSLPEFVPGGRKSPLGSRALYLGDTLYRIHGTWKIREIGLSASSGCIRMLNDQVAELYDLVEPGVTQVVVTSYLPDEMFAEGGSASRARNVVHPISAYQGLPPHVPVNYKSAAYDPLKVPAWHKFGHR
jgi:lipoprotein-anchoring transpeptidase ErfK/SrfK